MQNRIEVFTQMLAAEPSNTMVLFGLANEYLKIEDYANAIPILVDYLHQANDEGAAYGMLAKAYKKSANGKKAKNALAEGIVAATKHGHPSMSEEYQQLLELDYTD